MKKSLISSFNERRQCDYTFKNVDFFNSGYKYSMDILQDVRGRKQYIKLIPSNLKIRRNTISIDVQTKHIYNLIEMGKNGTKLL
jgi:hypothetical protein